MAGSSKKEVEERQRLHTLVQLQAQEVEALKAEIAILSRKGGKFRKQIHIFKISDLIVLFFNNRTYFATYSTACT